MKPKHIRQLEQRARRLRAEVLNAHTVAVESTSSPLANHIVLVTYEPDGTIHARCTCPWAMNGGLACSHVIAALQALASRRGRALRFHTSRDEARRQKRRTFRLWGSSANDNGVWITSRRAA